MPVERDASSVALLAPGLIKGDGDLGGISFGGSSVAENTFYINGLNVTDFYNRVGFSEVPYAFYKEFQVKTGGYSVEFGRTTGGVVNAVTRSGTNEFEFGTEVAWQPRSLQSRGQELHPRYITKFDDYDQTTADLYAGGPISGTSCSSSRCTSCATTRSATPTTPALSSPTASRTTVSGAPRSTGRSTTGTCSSCSPFRTRTSSTTDVFDFDLATGTAGHFQNTEFVDSGGHNWAATYTAYLTEGFSAKALYGKNERDSSALSLNDIDCSRSPRLPSGSPDFDLSCTSSTNVSARVDDRKAARLDFEWRLTDHQLRFGLDREQNTSDFLLHYPGPDQLLYDINPTDPGAHTRQRRHRASRRHCLRAHPRQ